MVTRLFLGTWGPRRGQGIWGADWNESTGLISRLRLVVETPNPTFLARHPRHRLLYAVNETAEYQGVFGGGLSVFAVDEANGGLRLLGSFPAGGQSPTHLAVSPDGTTLALAHYHGPGVACFLLSPEGMPAGPATVRSHKGWSVQSPRQDRPHPHGIHFDLSGGTFWVPDLGADQLVSYLRVNGLPQASQWVFQSSFRMPLGSGPRHLAWDAEGCTMYLVCELNNTLAVLAPDGAGRLQLRQQVSLLPLGYSGMSAAAEVAVHPTGRFVYASNRGADSITVFDRAFDGSLGSASYFLTRGRTPRHFNISPSGRWLITANQDSDSLVVFALDEFTGALYWHATHELGAPACVCF